MSCGWVLKAEGGEEWGKVSTVELYLPGLIETTIYPDIQIIRITGFFFENRLHWQSEEIKNSTNGCFRLRIYLNVNVK